MPSATAGACPELAEGAGGGGSILSSIRSVALAMNPCWGLAFSSSSSTVSDWLRSSLVFSIRSRSSDWVMGFGAGGGVGDLAAGVFVVVCPGTASATSELIGGGGTTASSSVSMPPMAAESSLNRRWRFSTGFSGMVSLERRYVGRVSSKKPESPIEARVLARVSAGT